ncbi:MAG: flagellar biosynthetic protein FliR [Nitrospirota bacterium]
MTNVVHLSLPQFQNLIVILVRVAGILAVTPILGSRSVPVHVKTGLVLVLSFVLLPFVQVAGLPGDPLLLGAGLSAEFLVGLVLGLGVRAVFVGIEVAGEVMGHQMGLGVVQLFDPTTSQQIPLVGHFQTLVASLVFLSLNAHFIVVDAIAHSFEVVAPFSARLSDAIVQDVVRISQGMFTVALKLAAPIMVTMLLINLAMAALGRTVPQLHVFILSFPLTIAAGLLVIGAALPFTVGLYEAEFVGLGETVYGLMRMLGHG